jgi:peroxiredoxin
MRSDIVPRAIFPDYELSDHTAKRRKLSELQGPHPMVLVLSRGGFCPKDRRQAELLVELHRELEVGYCRLVTISTDNITQTNETAAESAPTGLSSPTRGVWFKRISWQQGRKKLFYPYGKTYIQTLGEQD